jgi:hypothetical protein
MIRQLSRYLSTEWRAYPPSERETVLREGFGHGLYCSSKQDERVMKSGGRHRE